jgi:radical SAM superfamily enzyme YgiQ (UPF0313 family)
MRILLCNPRNSQGTEHSRKGMYVPLGILSIATFLKEKLGSAVHIDVCDEDVEELRVGIFSNYEIVGFYATTFNYAQAVRYAYFAREYGCITVLGGPHPTVLAKNILTNKNCFDYVIRFEAEVPFAELVKYLLNNGSQSDLGKIPNLAYKDNNKKVIINKGLYENVLTDLPIPSREFIRLDLYVENYREQYPEKSNIRPGSIYSSKGCSWRDKTGGCVFCARLEEGVRFRGIEQIWSEIQMLQDEYGVNSIWDIADDNLNNKDWFIEFVKKRPKSCQDVKFLIYSRVGPIKPWVIDHFFELNVEEIFLGIESGDNRILKNAFKGQTRELSYRTLELLNKSKIKFFPSFVLGLPGESKESLNNTFELCKDIAELGGLDRISSTILKPIPGSPSYMRVLRETKYGKDLEKMDDVDLVFLEKYWIDRFTDVEYETVMEYKNNIDELMSDYHVFGSAVSDKT